MGSKNGHLEILAAIAGPQICKHRNQQAKGQLDINGFGGDQLGFLFLPNNQWLQ
jgi:hypothetical protein